MASAAASGGRRCVRTRPEAVRWTGTDTADTGQGGENQRDHIEATASNVFFEKEGELMTPDLNQCGVAGVLREQIIAYCHDHGIALSVRDVHLREVEDSDALFVCNSIIGIWPVKRFDALRYSKSELTTRLMSVFNR